MTTTTATMPSRLNVRSPEIVERVRHSVAGASRLTPHQRGTLAWIAHYSRDGEMVHERLVGNHGACWRLVRKGVVEAARARGPRGGDHWYYRAV